MVKGYMDALPQYSQVGIPAECIEKISEYVNSWELAALPCGKYVIDGERIYVSIQEYETKSYGDCRFETHKRYADIQCILQGREQIWGNRAATSHTGTPSTILRQISGSGRLEKHLCWIYTQENWGHTPSGRGTQALCPVGRCW